jgi:hypothetical protein
MTVVQGNEERADLGEVVEAGIHLAEPTDIPHYNDGNHEHGFELGEVLRVVSVALAAAAVWFHLWEPFPRVSVIGLIATLAGGYPIFKEAFENILERRMTMELSMTSRSSQRSPSVTSLLRSSSRPLFRPRRFWSV